MSFLSNIFGRKPRIKKEPIYTPQQSSALNQMLSQATSGLSQQPLDFDPIAQSMRSGFQEQTIPSIAERFSAMGAQGSSAFPQALGQAGRGLERDIGAQRAQYGLQSQSALQNLLNIGLKPQQQMFMDPGYPGLAQQAFGGLIPFAGATLMQRYGRSPLIQSPGQQQLLLGNLLGGIQ